MVIIKAICHTNWFSNQIRSFQRQIFCRRHKTCKLWGYSKEHDKQEIEIVAITLDGEDFVFKVYKRLLALTMTALTCTVQQIL